jgi:iron(III) transport system permease protein
MGPFLVLLWQVAQAAGRDPGAWLWLAVPLGRRGPLLVRSLALAAGVAGAGTALGLLAATYLWRWHQGWLAYLRWLPLLLLPVPFCVHALAWWTLADGANHVLALAGLPMLPFQGGLASWWVQLMALLPLATGLALLGLETVDPALIDAGRVHRSDQAAFGWIVLPLAAPKLLAGAGFLFLLSITDYSVPSLFQFQVYAMEIFTEFSASHDPAKALALAAPLLLVAGAVVAGSLASLRDGLQPPAWPVKAWERPPVWPRWFARLQCGALGILVAQVTVLLLGLTLPVGSFTRLAEAMRAAVPEIGYSLLIAGLTAVLCLPLALAAARELRRARGRQLFWWLMIAAPLAIPAPLTGIGLITLSGSSWFPGLVVDTGMMPVLADLSRFTPWAAVVVLAQLQSINPLWLDAAAILQKNRCQGWFQVEMPILAPGLLAGAGLALVLSLGELGATLLVAPPGRATLCMRIYNFLHYGAADTVASLCLLLAGLVLLPGGGAVLILSAWRRRQTRSQKG